MQDNNFEQFPGAKKESLNPIPKEQDYSKSFETGVPPFKGNAFLNTPDNPNTTETATKSPQSAINATTETSPDTSAITNSPNEAPSSGESKEYDSGLADASAIIKYGIDAAVKSNGIESVIDTISNFDASGSSDPVKDLLDRLGVESPNLDKESTKQNVLEFQEIVGAPDTKQRTAVGAAKAIADMKELISEVRGADPRYADLRAEARTAQIGYFEQALIDSQTKSLSELFKVLAERKENPGNQPQSEEEQNSEN